MTRAVHDGLIDYNLVTSQKAHDKVDIMTHGTPEEPKNEKHAERPYSIYTRSEKWFIVTIISVAGLFRWSTPMTSGPERQSDPFCSPLTANIYFPAIPTVAAAFHKSIEAINLSVTVYMVFQGICKQDTSSICGGLTLLRRIAPMFWGTLADRVGRRPIFLACLLVLCLSCICLALIPTSAYWALMLLRCIQAAGSASTVALGMSQRHRYSFSS